MILLTLAGLKTRQFWSVFLIVLTLSGLVFVPGVAAQGNDSPTLTVVVAALNVRSGPGLTYPPFDILLQGNQVAIIGHDAASDWWQVQLPGGQTGWVSGGAAYVSVSGNTAGLPGNAPISNPSTTLTTGPQSPHVIVFQAASGGPIYAINSDGTNLHYLTHGLDPAVSPNGQQVAFTRWETSQDGALGSLWLINVDGSGERVILNDAFNARTPVWSPDGTQIALTVQSGGRIHAERRCGGQAPRGAIDIDRSRDEEGDIEVCYTLPPDPRWGLRLVNVATGTFEDLPHQHYSFSPAWDPANPGRLVYDGDRGLINLDISSLNKPTTWPLTGDFNDHSPAFSPDGSKIAVSYRQDNHWEVHVMNADGSGAVRLTETSYLVLAQQELSGQIAHSYNNATPAWSPDGSQLAFLTDRTGQWEIWVMNADGSNQRPMFPPGTLAGIPLQYNGKDEQSLSWR